METALISGLTTAVLTVLLCGSRIAHPIRRLPLLSTLLDCTFCTSFWVALVVDPSPTYFATIGVANITAYLIELGMGTYETAETPDLPSDETGRGQLD